MATDATAPTPDSRLGRAILRRSVLPTSGPWPTSDPFLFCVHHLDSYPPGNGALGPDIDLDGRHIGSDFSGLDGWSMYHGDRIPGFPQHPHRGFETVTFVRRGFVDHSDSMGASARYGHGDVQWMTAGAGIMHAEMFPLLQTDADNPLEMFQIWLNLPAASKMTTPHFSMMWAEELPKIEFTRGEAGSVWVTVVAGDYDGHRPPPPPPDSWASDPSSDVAIWLAEMEPDSTWEIPAATGGTAGMPTGTDRNTDPGETVRSLYVPHTAGSAVRIGAEVLEPGTMAVVACDQSLTVTAKAKTEVLVLQGRPIGESVAQYGPFVMNTEDEIHDAIADYRRTQFGGWPWQVVDPHHGADAGRFAVHADSTLDEPVQR